MKNIKFFTIFTFMILSISQLWLFNDFSHAANCDEYITCTSGCSGMAPNPQTYPSQWQTYVDTFNNTVRRVTDINTRIDYPSGLLSVENSDGTLLKLMKRTSPSSNCSIYTANDGVWRCNLTDYSPNAKFWWSATDPKVIYYTNDSTCELYKATINTSNWTISKTRLFTFSNYPAFQGALRAGVHDEGNPSYDCRYWPILIDMDSTTAGNQDLSTYLVLFDKDASGVDVIDGGAIIGYYEIPNHHAYCANISPSGDYIFYRSGSSDCSPSGQCVVAWKRTEFPNNNFILANDISPHFTIATDINGNDAFVAVYNHQLYMWRFKNPGNENKILLATYNDVCIRGAGCADVHFGQVCRQRGGPGAWIAVLSTDNDSDNECGYEISHRAELSFVRLSNNPLIWYVAHQRNESTSYDLDFWGGGDFDGKNYYFTSNWCGSQTRQVFRVELPPNWWSEIESCTAGQQNSPPQASASASPTTGNAPLLVSFAGSGTDADGNVVSCTWNFGDGSNPTTYQGATYNVQHTYSAPGTYTASLIVTDNEQATDSNILTINVLNPELGNYLVHSDFESDLDSWGGAIEAHFERVSEPGCSGEYCLHVTSAGANSKLSVDVRPENWDINQFPIVQFDYKIPKDTPVGVWVKAMRSGSVSVLCIGGTSTHEHGHYTSHHVCTLTDDNQWHTAVINIKDAIRSIWDTVNIATEFQFYTYDNAQADDEFWFDEFKIVGTANLLTPPEWGSPAFIIQYDK